MDSRHRETNSLADPLLLQKIDRLFACNVGQYVNLPQLVVVGDQSSGKSSVLEGLTGIAFPRHSELCTRYATHIIFQRLPQSRITVSIIPAAGSDTQTAQTLNAWRKDDLTCLDNETFLATMFAANDAMGVGLGKSTFSQHVLQIQITSPNEQHFSIIDIPGIFRTPSQEHQTTAKDVIVVRNMVQSYMENPRSIMLAVIPANADIATQEILSMAEDYDRDGQRTLGVLTKPDLVAPGDEANYVNMLLGKRHRLRLGWTAVRNPGTQDLEDPQFDRHAAEEEFFGTKKPWNTVDANKLGAKALRRRLQEVLANHVQREFPKVKKEIGQKLRSARQGLESLGPSREHHNDQRSFINRFATEFYDITHSAVRAQYDHPFFRNDPYLRIATKVANRNDLFSNTMTKLGHKIEFSKAFSDNSNDEKQLEEEVDMLVSHLEESVLSDVEQNESSDTSGPGDLHDGPVDTSKHCTRSTQNHDDLFEMLSKNKVIAKPSNTNIIVWLKKLHRDSRGLTLETFPSSLIPQAVNKQCSKWKMIAGGYISDVVCLVHTYILQLLKRVCPDDRIRGELVSARLDILLSKYEKAVKHVQFVADVEASDPLTLNHYFSQTLENHRRERNKHAILKVANQNPENADKSVLINSIASAPYASNAQHTVQDIHDVVRSYYKTALKRFIDNVCMQGAVYHLIKGPDTPLKVFFPDLLSELTEEQIERIAGEDFVTKNKRKMFNDEIRGLQEGMNILK